MNITGEWYQCIHVPQKHSCKSCDLRGLCYDNNGVKIITCVWRHREAIYDKETAEKIARETTANVIRIQKIEWEE